MAIIANIPYGGFYRWYRIYRWDVPFMDGIEFIDGIIPYRGILWDIEITIHSKPSNKWEIPNSWMV